MYWTHCKLFTHHRASCFEQIAFLQDKEDSTLLRCSYNSKIPFRSENIVHDFWLISEHLLVNQSLQKEIWPVSFAASGVLAMQNYLFIISHQPFLLNDLQYIFHLQLFYRTPSTVLQSNKLSLYRGSRDILATFFDTGLATSFHVWISTENYETQSQFPTRLSSGLEPKIILPQNLAASEIIRIPTASPLMI